MNQDFNTLRSFIDKIRAIGFFQRIFQWKAVRNCLIDASSALSKLEAGYINVLTEKTTLGNQLSDYKKDLSLTTDQKTRLEEAQKRNAEIIIEKTNQITELNRQLTTVSTDNKNSEEQVQSLKRELAEIKETLRQVQGSFQEEREECLQLKNEESARKSEHSKALATFEKLIDQVRAERETEKQQQHWQEIERLEKLKETWSDHQSVVKNAIKTFCNRHTIEYVEQVPFKGEPDNTIKICDEYIIFDAKSPRDENTSNFFTYLKTEAEKAKKYAKQENVKPDIFLVIPSNTWDAVKQTSFHLADYNVYLISLDSLEPIILSLKKIENYEFAQQLTPEERENICRVLGKFAHLTKRRIQIDSFFARQFMEIVYKCESSLPEDILEKVAEFEKAEKLNPPMEKRAKAIPTKQLELDVNNLDAEIGSKGIAVEDLSERLNGVRLYRE
jgi:hypothetical protein